MKDLLVQKATKNIFVPKSILGRWNKILFSGYFNFQSFRMLNSFIQHFPLPYGLMSAGDARTLLLPLNGRAEAVVGPQRPS